MEMIDKLFIDLESKENKTRHHAFSKLIEISDSKVEWVYDKWHDLLSKLESSNSFHRSIGLMLLANLCKSDEDNWFSDIIEKYISFFNDEKFITARQCIQNVWKIAIENEAYSQLIVEKLAETYFDNRHNSKHPKLIKQDVISSLREISNQTKDKGIKEKASTLIESENDQKLINILKKLLK